MEGKYSPGKPARKFYLSEEAAAMLFAESKRSTYPMSTLVDMAIKKCYGPQPVLTPMGPQPVYLVRDEASTVDPGAFEQNLARAKAAMPDHAPHEPYVPVRNPPKIPAPPKKDDPFDF